LVHVVEACQLPASDVGFSKPTPSTPGVKEPAEMNRGSEAGSYLRLIDFVYLSTLGLGVIKKKRRTCAD